ncbi:hypothetical protein HQ590_05415 [bacterium]|nr:hypothetical protein [bacterium]
MTTTPARSIRLDLPPTTDPLLPALRDLFTRRVAERSGVPVRTDAPGDLTLTLRLASGLGAEGYRIADGADGGLEIAGGDGRGLLYGVGKFLRTAQHGDGTLRAGVWRGTSHPRRPVRGIYLATHFHNYYHDAPVAEVARYVQELALWGCNALAVWFDMHHYSGIGDPAAQAMIGRLRTILQAAREVGMGIALTTLANEAYADSPAALRADWTGGHDGYTGSIYSYEVELCPSQPGALELMMRWRREMLEAFADLRPEYVWIWPYDQGGCTCAQCAPWGANGYLRVAAAEAAVIRDVLPGAKTIFSTWLFDHSTTGEWAGVAQAFARERPDWVDYVMADGHEVFPSYPLTHGVPGGFPLLNFPEISMYKMWPWGGYGANPLPRHIQEVWDHCGAQVSGGFPYSEGIFEDLNKAICLQHYWGDVDARDTVREYLAAEFSAADAGELAGVVAGMEAEHQHGLADLGTGQELKQPLFPREPATPLPVVYRAPLLRQAPPRAVALGQLEARWPERVRRSWRWRQFRLRAEIDAAIQSSGGRPTAELDALFEELNGMYHTGHGIPSVSPPSRAALLRGRNEL